MLVIDWPSAICICNLQYTTSNGKGTAGQIWSSDIFRFHKAIYTLIFVQKHESFVMQIKGEEGQF